MNLGNLSAINISGHNLSKPNLRARTSYSTIAGGLFRLEELYILRHAVLSLHRFIFANLVV